MYQTTILRRIHEQRILHDVTLELTYRCNLDCFYCYNDRDKPGTPLSLQQYRALLNDLASMQTMFLMLTGGEPMIHPYFFDIGRMTRELGFVVRIRTNGHSLGQRIAERLHEEVDPYIVEVSLHGATAAVHDKQTRVAGSFDRLVKNLATAKKIGLNCSVVSTPTAWNEQQIEDMFALCDSLGMPLRFQGPVAPRDNGDTSPLTIQPAAETWDRITEILKQRRRTQTADSIASTELAPATSPMNSKAKREVSSTCGVGVAGVDIDPYGNVLACMHLQESAGNLHQQSIEEIWNNSPLFQRARARSVAAAQRFADKPLRQYGAPLFCLAVEENANKQSCSNCASSCG